MIPTTWTPHRRESDDELVGYLMPTAEGTVVPVTLFGHPLAPAADEADAIAVLDAEGMACLAEPWWFTDDRGELRRVRIHEATPDHVTVLSDDFGYGGNLGDRVDLPVPDPGRLSRR